MFGLSFLNSILLFGLIAGIIPVLIHLFVKYRPKIVYFSSLRFLKEIQKNQAKIIKLRQILLLITRILIIVFLILALSRPIIKTLVPSARWGTHAPTVAVLIIDNSFSMNYLDEDQTLLDRTKETAVEIVDMLNDNDKVMLLTLNQHYNSQNNYFSKPSKIKDKINKISITDNSQLIKSVLLTAEMELAHQDVINKEIYFITDNQKYSWKNMLEESLGLEDSQPIQTDIFVIPIHQEKDKSNLTVVSSWFVPKLLSTDNRSEIRADIKNFSEKRVNNIIVSLVLNNITREEKVISLNPFQNKQVSFEFQDKGENIYYGSVKVKDEILPDDNNFYFNFPSQTIGKLPKILVISEYDIPMQFSAALDIITENNWQKITPENINDDIILNNYLFIFYRFNNFSNKLEFFADEILKNDKSIFIIPGEEISSNNNLNLWLDNKKVKFESINIQSSKIHFINKLHPISTIFSKEMFRKTRIDKIWSISSPEFTILFSDDKDNPIFIINDKLLISAIDFEGSWSNLIYQTAFPVLLYHIGEFLGEEESRLNNYMTGTPFPIGSKGSFECQLPNGVIVPILTGNENEAFTQTDQQGQYFLQNEDGLQNVFSFNVSREESDLSIISERDIKSLHELIPKVHFFESDKWKSNILTSRYGYEFWKILLWIVLALLVIEMILAYSGYKGYMGNRGNRV